MSESDGAEMSAEEEQAERARRRRLFWVTMLLIFGLPVYIVAASVLAAAINPVVETPEGPQRAMHWGVEALVYLALGVLWALPLKRLVQGLGKKKR